MQRIKQEVLTSIFFITVSLMIVFILNPLFLRNFTDINRLIVSLFFNFIMIHTVYDYKRLSKMKAASILLEFIIYSIFIIISAFFLHFLEIGRIDYLNEKWMFVTLMCFNLIYWIYRSFIPKDFRLRLTEILLVFTFLSSLTLYSQYVEKQNISEENIRYFISAVEETTVKMETISGDDLVKEIRFLENYFHQIITRFYRLNYSNRSLFDKLEDYVNNHPTESDKVQIKHFLMNFERDLQNLTKQKQSVSSKDLNQFLANKMQEFETSIVSNIQEK